MENVKGPHLLEMLKERSLVCTRHSKNMRIGIERVANQQKPDNMPRTQGLRRRLAQLVCMIPGMEGL